MYRNRAEAQPKFERRALSCPPFRLNPRRDRDGNPGSSYGACQKVQVACEQQ